MLRRAPCRAGTRSGARPRRRSTPAALGQGRPDRRRAGSTTSSSRSTISSSQRRSSRRRSVGPSTTMAPNTLGSRTQGPAASSADSQRSQSHRAAKGCWRWSAPTMPTPPSPAWSTRGAASRRRCTTIRAGGGSPSRTPPGMSSGSTSPPSNGQASASGASIRSRSASVVCQLRIVIDLYAGVPTILPSRLFVRSALSRCE